VSEGKGSICTWHFWIASLIFSTLISLKPLILDKVRLVAPWTDWVFGMSVRRYHELEARQSGITWKGNLYSYGIKPICFEFRDVRCTDA
jgi:hypothetical protein